MNNKLFDRSILGTPEEAMDFVTQILQSSTEYSIIGGDPNGTIVLWNEGARRLYGYEAEEIVGLQSDAFLCASEEVSLGKPEAISEEILRNGKWEGTLRRRRKNGEEFTARAVITRRIDSAGKFAGVLIISKDISEEIRLNAEVEKSKNELKLRTAELEKSAIQMKFLSHVGELLQSCVTPIEARQVVEQNLGAFFQVESGAIYLQSGPESLLEVFATWNHTPHPPTKSFDPMECWALRLSRPNVTSAADQATRCAHLQIGANGSSICFPMIGNGHSLGVFHLYWTEGDATPNSTEDASRLKVVALVAEMLARALSNFRIREMLIDQSIRDPLTRLYNRRYMEDTLNREVHRARRAGSTIGVMMIDVDNFKHFNDSFGHPAGDRLLRALANYLKSRVRPEDIPARYGGEEFIIILPGASADIVLARAKSLQEGFWEVTPNLGMDTLRQAISFSCGVANFPEHGASAEELLQSADEALYRAKKSGKNCVEIAITKTSEPVLTASKVV